MDEPQHPTLKRRLLTTILSGAVSGAVGFFVKEVLEEWQVLDPIAATFGGWLKANVTASQAGWVIALVVGLALWGTFLWQTRPRHIHHVPVQAGTVPKAALAMEVHQAVHSKGPPTRGPLAGEVEHFEPEIETREGSEGIAARIGDGPQAALPPPPWHAHHENDPSTWFAPGTIITVTNPDTGSRRIRLGLSEGRGYARIIPGQWTPVADGVARLQSVTGIPAIVGDARGFGWGISRGGMAVYRWADTPDLPMDVGALTQWFSFSGEFWGVANEFFFIDEQSRRTLATTYIIRHWCFFLSRNGYLIRSLGGDFPFHVRLGVTHLDDSWWPLRSLFPHEDRYAAVEESFEYGGELESTEEWDVFKLVMEAANGLAAAYGIAPWSLNEIAAIARGSH